MQGKFQKRFAPPENLIVTTMLATTLALLVNNTAFGATVKKVNSKKGLVLLDIGPDESLEVDSQVCIFNENDKKIDCGTVTKIKGKTATVKMKSKKKLKKIKPDMAARVPDAESGEAEESSSKSAAGKMPMGLLGRYIYTIAAPSSFKKNGYVVPSSKAPSTLWKDEGVVSSSALGFSLAYAIPVSKYSLIPGFRYRSLASAEVLSDYANDRRDPYVSSLTTASNIGLFFDFQFLRTALGPIAFFNMSSGLDIDASTVTFKAEKLDDTGATPKSPLASATSKLTVLSLRISGGLDLMFGKTFGVSTGLNVLLPLAAFGAQFSPSIEDAEKKGVENPGDDIKKAVDHKKNGFGAEFYLGPSLYF